MNFSVTSGQTDALTRDNAEERGEKGKKKTNRDFHSKGFFSIPEHTDEDSHSGMDNESCPFKLDELLRPHQLHAPHVLMKRKVGTEIGAHERVERKVEEVGGEEEVSVEGGGRE